jgi:hypothetical protein
MAIRWDTISVSIFLIFVSIAWQLINIPPPYKKFEGSLPCLQESATCFHPEPDESNPYPPTTSIYDTF